MKVFFLSLSLCLSFLFPVVLSSQNIFVVTSVADNEDIDLADKICADTYGKCTLRAAIQNANKDSALDTISFNISGKGPQEIVLKQFLPKIKAPVFLDASTQPHYSFTTPQVILSGRNLKSKDNSPHLTEERIKGLWLFKGSAGSTIRGFVMGGFGKKDFDPEDKAFTNIEGYAIILESGNNKIQGNFVGVAADGKTPFSNFWGVANLSEKSNLIGGTKVEERNIISQNRAGIFTYSNSIIEGNFLGTDVTGNLKMANVTGISLVRFATNVRIQNNLVSGNEIGIELSGKNNLVQENKIGTNVKGTAALPNDIGIEMVNSIGNIVGSCNMISGNRIGISLENSKYDRPDQNRIMGNYIGTDLSGVFAIPNEVGIYVNTNSSYVIGGENPQDRNVISGNTQAGIKLYQSNSLFIQNNYIGTAADGDLSLPNEWGILFQKKSGQKNNNNNVIEKNLISGNNKGGIYLSNATHTGVFHNRIGLKKTDDLPLPNEGNGIVVNSSAIASCIGGEDISKQNFIAYNKGHGIFFEEEEDSFVSERQSLYNKIHENCEMVILPVPVKQE